MPFISGGDRRQVMFAALDDMVAPDSEARVIDAFVGSLDLDAMGFARAEPAQLAACLRAGQIPEAYNLARSMNLLGFGA